MNIQIIHVCFVDIFVLIIKIGSKPDLYIYINT
jgi:hypothetical protein